MKKRKHFKIIDFHIHIGLKEHWNESLHRFLKSIPSEYYRLYHLMSDPSQFASYLKALGLEKAVILPEINPTTTGTVPNEFILDFAKADEIYVPFCTLNPSLSSNLLREFRRLIKMGARGIKLYPSYNHFYPQDSRLKNVYAEAQELRIPVLIHTGSSIFKGTKIKYADPIHLDDVAADFPDLLILMAHSGRGLWYEKAFFLSRLHPNLFMEISGLPPKNLLSYFPQLEKNSEKIVYGSDWPGLKSMKENLKAILELPLSEKTKRNILYENASSILAGKTHNSR